MSEIIIGNRMIDVAHPPFIIPEVGINHEGSFEKAIRCIGATIGADVECVKFQSHITEAEMVETYIKPGNFDYRLFKVHYKSIKAKYILNKMIPSCVFKVSLRFCHKYFSMKDRILRKIERNKELPYG